MVQTQPTYYKRERGLYDPKSPKPFKISRSKIELSKECPRCFYLDRKFGVPRPSFPAFTLNSAVDHLLKKEFDLHRAKGEAHPFMKAYGIDAVPFDHKKMDEWRHNFSGVQAVYTPTNMLVFGAVDDVWTHPNGKLIVVDYKATAKDQKPDLEGFWQQAYKRQMEIYQWLLRQNNFDVSNTGYFVYVNGKRDNAAFDGKLEFDVDVISYEGDASWVEGALVDAKKILDSVEVPPVGEHCEYCPYREYAGKQLRDVYIQNKKRDGKLF